MSLLPSTHNNALQKRRGIAKFAPRNPDGSRQAQINMSPSAELGFTISTESSGYTSQESGNAEILDTSIDSINRNFSLTCNRMTAEIRALFVGGTVTDLAQTAATVTGEATPYVFPDRSIQLGGATNNSAGIFGATAVSASFLEGEEADDRANEAEYQVGDVYVPATPNSHWYMCLVAGESAAAPPTFSTTGTTFADGTATFIDMGLIAITNTDSADFEVDEKYAVINVPNTGAIATAFARVPAALRAAGRSFRLSVDYTRSAQSVQQIATGASAAKEGEFWLYSQNPKGDDEVWYCPFVTLTPNGDSALKSGSDYGAMGFQLVAQKPPTQESIYINGVPQNVA